MSIRFAGTVCAICALSPVAAAQWSDDPAVNLPIADRTAEQTQVKIAVRADGGAYISWFDNSTGGFDVYLQRIDSAGVEQWAHNGVLIADRGFSSTQDYDLDIDSLGNALLTFRDDRFTGTQITATSIASDGTENFSIQLTNTTAFVANPKISGTTDGNIVVAWKQDNDIRARKIDATGSAIWLTDTVISDGGVTLAASDMDASDGGSVIISVVRGFIGATLHAQKLDTNGSPAWTTPFVDISGGALQIANFPQFVPDGAGGGVFAWYQTSRLQCYAQRLDSNGSALFSAGGVTVSTNGTRNRVAPDVDFNDLTGETYVFWTELNGAQSQFGVRGQKFDATGAREWGAEGLTLVPLGSEEITQVRTVEHDGGVVAAWVRASSFGNDRIVTTRLDDAGAFTWRGDFVEAASTGSDKSRLVMAEAIDSAVMLAWADDRTDANDIYAQNINDDGSLGATAAPCPWDCVPRGGNGTVNFDDLIAVVNAISTQDLACDVAPDNGDGTFGNGVITFDDLIAVINNFGDCP